MIHLRIRIVKVESAPGLLVSDGKVVNPSLQNVFSSNSNSFRGVEIRKP